VWGKTPTISHGNLKRWQQRQKRPARAELTSNVYAEGAEAGVCVCLQQRSGVRARREAGMVIIIIIIMACLEVLGAVALREGEDEARDDHEYAQPYHLKKTIVRACSPASNVRPGTCGRKEKGDPY
jgi:hypothetical protein